MKRPDHNPSPEQNPQFALLNEMVARYVAALGLAKEMQERADLDPLTGLHNRRALEDAYHGLQGSGMGLRASEAGKKPGGGTHSLILLDIDYFKDINDIHGHSQGDRMLKNVADVIAERTRKRDVAARIGGEEFAVLLPRTTIEQAEQVAEDIRRRTEEAGEVTLSAGVAGFDVYDTLEQNLERADQALYSAKELGRNQVASYQPSAYRD